MLRTLICILALSASVATYSSPWDADSVKSIFSGRRLDPVEGVWQFPADGARLLIVKSSSTTFDIILLDSPRLDVKPGTIFGNATVTPKAGQYTASIDKRLLGEWRLKKTKVILTLLDNGNLDFQPYSDGLKISLRRLVPYLWRVSIEEGKTPANTVGAQRIYPKTVKSFRPSL